MTALYLTAMGAFVLAIVGLWDTLYALTRRSAWEEQHHAVAAPLMALSEAKTVLQRAKNLPLVHANRRSRSDRARDRGVEVVA
ncbi:hypothetical protein LRH25_11835 [Ideonella azotifigens]|uniref:Uncharacterized protein n=1 Tax=Ideonella azotifigens TaxID=513160 RepID=A0ABP3V1A8_9BURK|nr:hypothetical protein [Ideonella azotifigens]MCD2341033.1 hypothetical protein [Ideonella azotifigens]